MNIWNQFFQSNIVHWIGALTALTILFSIAIFTAYWGVYLIGQALINTWPYQLFIRIKFWYYYEYKGVDYPFHLTGLREIEKAFVEGDFKNFLFKSFYLEWIRWHIAVLEEQESRDNDSDLDNLDRYVDTHSGVVINEGDNKPIVNRSI